jgi:hypothetical protein
LDSKKDLNISCLVLTNTVRKGKGPVSNDGRVSTKGRVFDPRVWKRVRAPGPYQKFYGRLALDSHMSFLLYLLSVLCVLSFKNHFWGTNVGGASVAGAKGEEQSSQSEVASAEAQRSPYDNTTNYYPYHFSKCYELWSKHSVSRKHLNLELGPTTQNTIDNTWAKGFLNCLKLFIRIQIMRISNIYGHLKLFFDFLWDCSRLPNVILQYKSVCLKPIDFPETERLE